MELMNELDKVESFNTNVFSDIDTYINNYNGINRFLDIIHLNIRSARKN